MDGPDARMTSAALVTAIISISFASIFIRWSEAPAEVIAAYRMGFAALIILPLVLREGNRREVRNLRPRQWLAVMVVGTILALHFLTFNAALEATSVASATVLITCHPLVVGILGYVFLKELPRRSGLGVALGISGVLVISSADLTGGALNGDLLALVGMMAAALYLLGGRVLRRELGAVTYVFLVYLACAAGLFLTALMTGAPLWPYPWQELLLFAALAVVSTTFGHTLLNWSLGHLPAVFVSLSMLGEPVGASLLALLLLSEQPSIGVVAGAVLVLTGILLTSGPALRSVSGRSLGR